MGNNIIRIISENIDRNVDFEEFPDDVLKTLKNEYSNYYQPNFDWNEKTDKFGNDHEALNAWLDTMNSKGFIDNLDTLIRKTGEDIVLLNEKKNADKALEMFEDLIKPTLGSSVLTEPLSKFMEDALLNLHSIKELNRAYTESKSIIDDEGSIDQSKITDSEIFKGGDINLPAFERYAKNNPEFKGVFEDWKKLFDKSIDLSLKGLNAYRNSTPLKSIVELHTFLKKFKSSI